MDEIKQEIKKYIGTHFRENDVERLTQTQERYELFVERVLKHIFDVEYKSLIEYINNNCIDSMENIKKYSHELLCFYMSQKSPYVDHAQSVVSKTQNFIFWHQGDKLLRYESPYFIEGLQKYEEDRIIIFYRNKKSEKLPLASVVDLNGNELFSVDFPTTEDNECVNGNISCYGGGVHYENSKPIMQVVLTNGGCRRDFWCKYDLDKKEYIETGISY